MILLTDFWTKKFYHNTVEEWAISLAIILGGVVAAKILYWIIGKFIKQLAEKSKSKLDDILVDKLEEPIVFAVGLGAAWYAFSLLHFTFTADDVIDSLFHIALVVNITWFIARTVDALIDEYVLPLVEKSDSSLDDQIMPIIRKGIRSIIWVLGVIVALNNAGINVTGLIAGLGIGGLALALAAQDSVKNIFGGILIFVDKPFKMGDRIVINGIDGVVEIIGLRSTRVRKLNGRLVTIPNSFFADNEVENISAEPSRKVAHSLGLTYDTPPEKVQKAIDILMQILKDNADIVSQDTWTLFDSYGDFSLNITFVYYIKKEADIPKSATKVNLDILDRFNKAGLEFAFPTHVQINQEG